MSLETCSGDPPWPPLVKEEPENEDNFSVEVDGTRLDADDELKQEPEMCPAESLRPNEVSVPAPISEQEPEGPPEFPESLKPTEVSVPAPILEIPENSAIKVEQKPECPPELPESLKTTEVSVPAPILETIPENTDIKVEQYSLEQEPECPTELLESLKPTEVSVPAPMLEIATENGAIKVEQYSLRDCSVLVKFEHLDETHHCNICDKTFAHESILESHKCSRDDTSEAYDDLPNDELDMESNEDVYISELARRRQLAAGDCYVRLVRFDLEVLRKSIKGRPVALHEELSIDEKNAAENIENKPVYTCDFCGKQFVMKNCLVKHITWHSFKPTGKNLEKDACVSSARPDKVESRGCFVKLERVDLDALWNRRDNQALGKEPNVQEDNGVENYKSTYTCNYCGKIYLLKRLLVKHILWHMNEAAREETYFDYRHIDTVQKECKNEFTCNYCDKRFTLKTQLIKHVACHTKDSESNIEDKVEGYICDYCGKMFGRKLFLLRHISLHMDIMDSVPEDGVRRTNKFKPNVTKNRLITCKECSQTFIQVQAYEIHRCYAEFANKNGKLDTAESPKKPECKICKTKFKNNKCLKRHVDQFRCVMIPCDVCGKHIKKAHFQGHKLYHSADTRCKCEICEKGFTNFSSLKLHLRYHTGKKLFSCDVCGKSFVTLANLKSHKLVHSDEKPYFCDICGKIFRRLEDFKRHVIKHSSDKSLLSSDQSVKKVIEKYRSYNKRKPTKEEAKMYLNTRKYSCTLCKSQFTSESLLKAHESVHTGEKLYACEICGEKFRFKRSIVNHERDVHNKQDFTKVYKCKICKIKLKTQRNLEEHERLHTGDKQYACNICERRFSFFKSFQMHKSIHTLGLSMSCDICDKKFSFPLGLRRHKLLHTEGGAKCKVCGKLVTKSSLKTHERYHEGKFSCEICEKGYKSYYGLQRHLVIHTGEKKYECDMCQKKFFLKELLSKHIRTHQTIKY